MWGRRGIGKRRNQVRGRRLPIGAIGVTLAPPRVDAQIQAPPEGQSGAIFRDQILPMGRFPLVFRQKWRIVRGRAAVVHHPKPWAVTREVA